MVRVIIERRIKEGQEEEFWLLTARIRAVATGRPGSIPGLIGGETLICSDDPGLTLTVTTWSDRESWEAHVRSPAGRAIAEAFEPLLAEPVKVTVFEIDDGSQIHWDAQLPYDVSAPVV